MYQVDFTPGAESDLSRLDVAIAQRVLNRLRWLAENFEAIRPQRLSGQWQTVFKRRVGDYRMLYTLDQTTRKIVVHFIRHRRDVYKSD